jgi:hypothetical protein
VKEEQQELAVEGELEIKEVKEDHENDSNEDDEDGGDHEDGDAEEDEEENGYEPGSMSIVAINRQDRVWALVDDVADTADGKLQGNLFSSVSSKCSNAYCKGVARQLGTFIFVPRYVDSIDRKEFHGTPENLSKYIENSPLPHVFDSEDDFILEGFSLENGLIPPAVIELLTKELKSKKRA